MNQAKKHDKIQKRLEEKKTKELQELKKQEREAIKRNKQIIDDIASLERLIVKYKLDNIIETYPLSDLVGNAIDSGNKFQIKNLTFRITSSSQKPKPFVTRLNVSIILAYEYNENSNEDEHDIFKDYQFNLEIKGYNKETDEKKKFFCWHLDKEPDTNGRFIHPLYHFHAGGNHMSDKVEESSDSFVISSPRLAHPPMDIILSIHFLIQNFIDGKENEQKNKLLSDPEYIGIIERAQKRVLDPYFNAISCKTNYKDYNKTNLFPLYV